MHYKYFGKIKNTHLTISIVLCMSLAMIGIGIVEHIYITPEKAPEFYAPHIRNSSQKPAGRLGFPAHGNITITSNAEFASHPNITGTGTVSDPYIFENYSIATTGISGIAISHTDAHFIIRNVELTGSNNSEVGAVELYNVTNASLTNMTAINSVIGFILDNTSSITLNNNTATSNIIGFYVLNSSSNTLNNNIATSNSFYGFLLDSSSNNNVLNNNVANSNSEYGFYIFRSSNNTLNNNTATSNTLHGFSIFGSSNNTLLNNTATSNTFSGFYLALSSNNNLNNNIATSNTLHGFSIFGSSNNTLLNNTASNNDGNGFYLAARTEIQRFVLLGSANNSFTFNVASNNRLYAVFIFDVYSVDNTFGRNNFINNNQGATQAYDSGLFNIFTENYWDDWTGPDSNQDGIVDLPYLIDGNATNQDLFPQVALQLPNEIENISSEVQGHGDPQVGFYLLVISISIVGFLGTVLFFLVRQTGSTRPTTKNIKNFAPKNNQLPPGPHEDVLHSVEDLVKELDKDQHQ